MFQNDNWSNDWEKIIPVDLEGDGTDELLFVDG
jgi:hypothetical protein